MTTKEEIESLGILYEIMEGHPLQITVGVQLWSLCSSRWIKENKNYSFEEVPSLVTEAAREELIKWFQRRERNLSRSS